MNRYVELWQLHAEESCRWGDWAATSCLVLPSALVASRRFQSAQRSVLVCNKHTSHAPVCLSLRNCFTQLKIYFLQCLTVDITKQNCSVMINVVECTFALSNPRGLGWRRDAAVTSHSGRGLAWWRRRVACSRCSRRCLRWLMTSVTRQHTTRDHVLMRSAKLQQTDRHTPRCNMCLSALAYALSRSLHTDRVTSDISRGDMYDTRLLYELVRLWCDNDTSSVLYDDIMCQRQAVNNNRRIVSNSFVPHFLRIGVARILSGVHFLPEKADDLF